MPPKGTYGSYQNRTLPICKHCGSRVRSDGKNVHGRPCKICGKPFCCPGRSQAEVCFSPRCRTKRKSLATKKQMKHLPVCDLCGRRILGKGAETHKRKCTTCGKSFCRPYGNGEKLTCSDACAKEGRKQKSFKPCKVCGKRTAGGVLHNRKCEVCGKSHCNQGQTCSRACRDAKTSEALLGHAPNPGSGNGKGGRYQGVWMRSTWERNYARILNHQGKSWVYEPTTFKLPDGSGYTPDFFLPDDEQWVEIKGYISDEWRHKLAQFREAYPELELKVVGPKRYSTLLEQHQAVRRLEN